MSATVQSGKQYSNGVHVNGVGELNHPVAEDKIHSYAEQSAAAAPAPAPSAPTVCWSGPEQVIHFAGNGLDEICSAVDRPVYLVRAANGAVGASLGGEVATVRSPGVRYPLVGMLPQHFPEWLGDRSFGETHGTRYAYVTGEMAHGIASPAMVIAAGRAGMLGFLGTAGLSPARIESAIAETSAALDPEGRPWGVNLIHNTQEPLVELETAKLFVRLGVMKVSASAFMSVTPAVVYLAAKGASLLPDGTPHRARHLFAKVSRPETAKPFMSPPPADILKSLVAKGELTEAEATAAAQLPIAEDITVEADSGGHTDNRPASAILPRVTQLRDQLMAVHGYARRIRVGAAGGLGTPQAVAAAFNMGADYIVTGSVNQTCVESGLSADARRLLMTVDVTDMGMAAAGDMFELGVKVQVLKRGTMFAGRANQLYTLYSSYNSLDEIPATKRAQLEKDVFRASIDEIWRETEAFFAERDPSQIERAARDPKHQMALVFRWYLGKSVHWAISGEESRRMDYQIWCGPALGAFNHWVSGTFLEAPEARTIAQVGLNLLLGAAVAQRAQMLRSMGVAVPSTCFNYQPTSLV